MKALSFLAEWAVALLLIALVLVFFSPLRGWWILPLVLGLVGVTVRILVAVKWR